MEVGKIRNPYGWKRASLMPRKNIKHYRQTHCYIFDDVVPGADVPTTLAYRNHQRYCSLMKDFFHNNVDCQLHSVVHTATDFTEADFVEWWTSELDNYKKSDLVVVYFNGHATGRGTSYTWKFFTKPRKLNAYELFKATNTCRPDCLWILECPFPTRFLDIPSRSRGHSDYTIAGQNLDFSSTETERVPWDYTFQTAQFLQEWVDGIETRYKHWHKRKSIPEILSIDRDLCSNPLRLWERKTERGSGRPVYRLCIEPDDVRASGHITFERVRIQGPDKVEDALNDNSDSEDEDDEDNEDNGNQPTDDDWDLTIDFGLSDDEDDHNDVHADPMELNDQDTIESGDADAHFKQEDSEDAAADPQSPRFVNLEEHGEVRFVDSDEQIAQLMNEFEDGALHEARSSLFVEQN